MLSNMFKVTKDYEPSKSNRDKHLKAEKGDILIDCEMIDEHWFRGRNMINETVGKIPKTYIEAFNSNDNNETVESKNTTYEDIDSAEFDEPEEKSRLLPTGETQGNSREQKGPILTANPLLDVVDDLLEREYTDCNEIGNLSKFKEATYVDMSSEETINELDSIPTELTNNKASIPSKPKRSHHDSAKVSDDGYNSGSHYSGENGDSAAPLLGKPKSSKQDEAGYELPHVVCNVKIDQDSEVNNQTSKVNKSTKMRFPFGKIQFSRRSNEQKSNRRVSTQDEIREKYYDPPADHRDSYFLPQSNYPIIRILLSFIAALGISLGLFIVLHIIVGLHPVLCFSLSVLSFTVILIAPVTLQRRGICCVASLCIPSLVSHQVKIGLIILLNVMLICGPILGVVDKLNFVGDCQNYQDQLGYIYHSDRLSNVGSTRTLKRRALRYEMQEECYAEFTRVNEFCSRVYGHFRRNCKRYNVNDLSPEGASVCKKSKIEFCKNQTLIKAVCSLGVNSDVSTSTATTYVTFSAYRYIQQESNRTEKLREILIYLLPLLLLLVIWSAYSYNRRYLCTKNTDNIYITQRLRELDCERKNRGLTDLIFPLTRIEFHTYLVRRTYTWSLNEKISVAKWIGTFVALLVTIICLVALEDQVDNVLLLTLNPHCKTIYETGHKNDYRLYIYFLIALLLFVVFVQSHVLRTRSMICEYFYSDMVDIRSKHLYYKILHDRHTFARHVRRKIQLKSEDKRLNRRMSFKTKAYSILPERLQRFCSKLTVRKCMICNSISYQKTVECTETNCMAHYCYECYVDAGQQCLTCKSISNNERAASIAI